LPGNQLLLQGAVIQLKSRNNTDADYQASHYSHQTAQPRRFKQRPN